MRAKRLNRRKDADATLTNVCKVGKWLSCVNLRYFREKMHQLRRRKASKQAHKTENARATLKKGDFGAET
jgi:hypothetical protein